MYNTPTGIIDGKTVQLKNELKQLGFHWKTNTSHKSYIDENHIKYQINEFWASTRALISSEIHFLHPNSISILFQSILIPKLTYGLEIGNITAQSCNQQSLMYIVIEITV